MERRGQRISKDEMLEVIGKGKPFTLLQDIINNKREHLSDKFTPSVPNDVLTLSDCEDVTENEDEDDLPNAILIRFIESQEEYLRKVADGTSHIFRKIRDIESTPFKEN